MPTAMHFLSLQYWQRLRLILRMAHCWFLVQGRYWIFCWIERRKKPWKARREGREKLASGFTYTIFIHFVVCTGKKTCLLPFPYSVRRRLLIRVSLFHSRSGTHASSQSSNSLFYASSRPKNGRGGGEEGERDSCRRPRAANASLAITGIKEKAAAAA